MVVFDPAKPGFCRLFRQDKLVENIRKTPVFWGSKSEAQGWLFHISIPKVLHKCPPKSFVFSNITICDYMI